MSFLLNQLSYELPKIPSKPYLLDIYLCSQQRNYKKWSEMTRNARKMAIYKSQILGITLYTECYLWPSFLLECYHLLRNSECFFCVCLAS